MTSKRIKSIVATFIPCYAFWLMLTMSISATELISGFVVCAIAAWFSSRFFVQDEHASFRLANPIRLLMLLYYIFVVFMWEVLKANIKMAKLVLSGKPVTNQAIVKIPVEGIRNYYALAALADCITLTPGTISYDYIEEDGKFWLYVQWIDMESDDPEKAGEIIKGPMEGWIRRIWE